MADGGGRSRRGPVVRLPLVHLPLQNREPVVHGGVPLAIKTPQDAPGS